MKDVIYIVALVLGINFLLTFFQKEEKTIYIQGLNDYDKEDLYLVKKTIEDNFDFKCQILSESYTINSEDEINSGEVQSTHNEPVGFIYDKTKPIKVLVTNMKINSPTNPSVLGVTYGNTIYVSVRSEEVTKITIVHELYHNLGLNHCTNKCVMNIDRNNAWDEKNNKPILCDGCYKILKK